jgi:hypothetical protein
VNILAQLEKLIERLIEGSFSWLFKPRFHPADLTRALALEMEKATIEAHGRRLAPSHYQIYLSMADFQTLQAQTTLPEEIDAAKRYLARLQAEMGYDRPADLQISISPRSDIPPGQILVAPSAPQQ